MATPSVATIDYQLIRTAEGGDQRGFDAGKTVTGRRRHLAVNTLGLVWAVVVHAASWQDYDGAALLFNPLRWTGRLRVLFAESAYGRSGLSAWVKETIGWAPQTVLRPVQEKGHFAFATAVDCRTHIWLVHALSTK